MQSYLGPEKSKYGSFDPSNLQRLDPRNAPAAPAAASRGALPPGPSGPGASPAFANTSGVGEARKPQEPQNQFFNMWREGTDDERDEIASQQEQVFAQKGMSLEGATKMLFDQGGEVAAQIGAKFGLVPPASKAGMPAFKTQEQALADIELKKEERAQKKEELRREKRRAMGGFLMEMGLRILSSGREDAAGAIGEGALGTIGARRGREAAAKEAEIAEAERKRKADLAERAETRLQKESDARIKEMEKPDLAQITDKDGNVIYVEEQAGYVTDDKGNRVRKATDSELSAAQRETTRRAEQSQLQSERRAVQKLVDEGFSDDPEIQAIIDEEDPKRRREMIAEVARKRVASLGTGNAAGNDPLGLGL